MFPLSDTYEILEKETILDKNLKHARILLIAVKSKFEIDLHVERNNLQKMGIIVSINCVQ